MRSLNTQITALLPILSVLVVGSLVLGATTLQEFGLALFIGQLSGAYSSIFIASPVLALLKEREPRYRALRKRLEERERRDRSRGRPRGRAGPRGGHAGAGDRRRRSTVGPAAGQAGGVPRLGRPSPTRHLLGQPPAPAAQEGEAALTDAARRTSTALVRDIPDFPKPGIVFKDITPLLADAAALRSAVDGLADPFAEPRRIDQVLGIEARGFIVAAPVAYLLGAGFVPVRKAGQAARTTIEREEYELEYGTDLLEIHRDAVEPGERVLIVDDVLATGGTAAATVAAGRAARRRGGRLRLPHRARLPRRPRPGSATAADEPSDH